MTVLTLKKAATMVVALGLTMSLTACGNQEKADKTNTSSASKDTATITLDFENDKKVDETKQVTISKNQTLLEALKENFKVDEKGGFITSIDGKKQDEAAKKYWMFDINGKMADKGAADIQLKKGDKVAFYLGSF
ncbi:DUF4430 domain-containing protein [Pseudolactococcus plantarum]|uniref:Additional lipoprotein component of predicted cobalamin ECF transporter n=1 Tax=Pseudolactococcus plantarum TaxID=1365 RepID=A0A2A5S4D8_9LACT|nr:DUF4430 domain-containing protein [Lactococcus plantarum]PCS08334.1 Additional lipoprotein component of predicted cobalamin ECF transporter [Lactococcus plantarum]